ncbi:hypothetical protein BGX33_001903 [Mortierella sp. NVP41]|nr:hypothetical protein BGX33_001903 [Mortierella sp. NVP41]
MDMSNTLIHKYHTLKAKKSSKRLSSQDIFPPSAQTTTTTAQPSYTSFIGDLVSAFNSLSTPTASSTSSSTLHTSFQGTDHEAHVDGQQKKKVIKALQSANPAQVNEIIALLKAMPDPTTAAAAVNNNNNNKAKKSHSRDLSQQSLLSLVQDKAKPKETIKKQKTKDQKKITEKDKENRVDDKLGGDWDMVEKKWSWETQKSNDQTTGVVIATAGSWLFSSATPAATTTTASQATSKQPVKITKSTSAGALSNDATNIKTTGFGSLWLTTTTKSKPPLDPSSLHNKKNNASIKRTGTTTTTSLSTGEQIAQAAATLLATAAVANPKEPKQPRRQTSMPNIRTATLKRLLTTTRASTTDAIPIKTKTKTDSSSSSFFSSSSSAVTSSSPTAPSYLSSTLTNLTRQWMTLQSGPPPTHMMSAYTYWWGFEIYVPHKCMDKIERVSNTSQIFFSFLSSTVSAIPGLAALVPIAKIIAAWVGYQWAVIKTQDAGKGVVISATWVLPVALASRPWDHCGCEDDPFPELPIPPTAKKTLKSKLRLSGA